MNKSIKLNQYNKELIDQYEKLRAAALDKSKITNPPCFSIFLFRGMASWLEVCLCSELSQVDSCRPQTTHSHQPLQNLDPIHKEMTMILTNMVLSHQKKSRNSYA